MSQKRSVKGYLFILPWLMGFAFFYVYCLILNVRFSLSELTVGSGSGYEAVFVGLKNFIYAFRAHADFKQVLTDLRRVWRPPVAHDAH
jgi:ABC-type sugar transport system permease subunit